nr:MAG TPA: hypothetical protein [Caudoviricetes sp.]
MFFLSFCKIFDTFMVLFFRRLSVPSKIVLLMCSTPRQ